MLIIKNIYALLLVSSIQLGCSLKNSYQMDQGGEKRSKPTSSVSSPECQHKDHNDLEVMRTKVNKFLETKKFNIGSKLDDNEINLVIKGLGRDINDFNSRSLDKGYKEFLNEFGRIYGEGFKICGPTPSITSSERKVQYIESMQRGFENRCRINELKPAEIKYSWLIAETDQMNNHESKQYYINLSNSGKGHIYCMDLHGKSDFFAEDFLDFLDKFFEEYQKSIKTKMYQESMLR